MIKRIAAIAFIFICTCVAWAALGGTIMARTYSTDSTLRDRVASIWGAPQRQVPPVASYERVATRIEESLVDGKKITRKIEEKFVETVAVESSTLDVALDLQHRQKGLLWYSTYAVRFSGGYVFRPQFEGKELVTVRLKFPTQKAIYDDLVFQLDDVPVTTAANATGVEATVPLNGGKPVTLRVGYRSQGLSTWAYAFGESEVNSVRDFSLRMATNFKDIDFPEDSLSPTEKAESGSGWKLVWTYKNFVTGVEIGMVMPEKLQPGPLAGQISFFAPVSLFFFFFLMFIITTMRNIDLHPMNYFFLATAFFAFHLLLAYLVDHISIHLAFVICSAVSIFLVISYLRLAVGMRFAAVEAGISQFVYLVLFSYAFFFKGFTGLAVTIGAIITLFLVMQMTGKIRWEEKFRALAPLSARIS